MALNINGTTGISGVDGSASAPAVQGTDSNTGVSFGADTVNINTGGQTRATVDSAGRLLLGTTTEGQANADNLTIDGGDAETGITIRSGTSKGNHIYFSDGTSGDDEYRGIISYQHSDNKMQFFTNASERMRIDSSGNVGIGTTQPNNLDSADGGLQINPNATNGSPRIGFKRPHTGSTSHCIVFVDNITGVGSISFTNSGTSFNTSSDYRLKENVVSISDGITRVKQLIPKRFNFINDETNTLRDGFIAHEVSSIVPEAITGTKDETEDILYTEKDTIPSGKKVGDVKEVKPVYQGIDQAKLVPLLTAALQEAIAKIEVLETKVAALEAG
mgnify:CR=1 FL=1